MLMYCAIKLYKNNDDEKDRNRSGRPNSVRIPQAVKSVKARIQPNSLSIQKIMPCEYKYLRKNLQKRHWTFIRGCPKEREERKAETPVGWVGPPENSLYRQKNIYRRRKL